LYLNTNYHEHDCKKALTEANGDFEAAIDVLRKQGQKVAAKRADRDAAEGAVIAMTNETNTRGVIVSLNCETDFVAKNEGFVDMAKKMASIAIANFPATKEDLLALSYEGSLTIAEKLTEQTGVIGEKIEIAYYETIEGGVVAGYIHAGNKLATLAALSAGVAETAKDVAMQAAAMNPVGLDRTSVSADVIERELEIARDQVRQEGKPEDMIEKIAQGKLGKFYKENTLVEQDFIKDGKLSVAQYVASASAGATVTGFRRVGLGV
jgi:elongation factor Ts